MRSKEVLSHIFLSLVLYNAMAMGANLMLEDRFGYLAVALALGSAFMLGMQAMLIIKGDSK